MPPPAAGARRLLCVIAHPDDESLAMGGTLATYAAAGVEVHVLAATRGQSGRYRDNSDHPGPEALGRIRDAELRAAARTLGVREVRMLDYVDGRLDRADPTEVSERIASYIREVRGATPWSDWAITTSIDASPVWETVWEAVRCHVSQIDAFNRLGETPPEVHRKLWGRQEYYRALSLVNGGRELETDLFAGLDDAGSDVLADEDLAA